MKSLFVLLGQISVVVISTNTPKDLYLFPLKMKKYQKQSDEKIEREKMLISVLEQLQSDQSVQNEAYQSIQKSYIESLQAIRQLESQVSSLSEQNLQLAEHLERLIGLLRK